MSTITLERFVYKQPDVTGNGLTVTEAPTGVEMAGAA